MPAIPDVSTLDLRPAPPLALQSRNPLRWLTVFGPGAIIASLTISAGELIFSSRAGALFGYRLLWFFVLILLLKWVLVFATARHLVLTGAHPLERWMEVAGPRGWLPIVFLLLGLVAFPVWVGFHAGTIGTLLSRAAGTESSLNGGAHFLWAIAVLGVVTAMVLRGGYASLERTQLVIVIAMLACVLISLLLLKPDWIEFLKGLFAPQPIKYPDWARSHPELAERPIWLETITYVGVLGGSGYDYLAYVSYLRDKGWGQAGRGLASPEQLRSMAADAGHANRRWLRAVWIDSVLSFLAVLIFAAVFTACGAIVLAPQHQVPGGSDLLTLQSQFVTGVFPWLRHVYFLGAFLAIFGTLYGTIEVAPAVLREMTLSFKWHAIEKSRLVAVLWVCLGGFAVLVAGFLYSFWSTANRPPGLVALLTPANLFTGVLACGLICFLAVWADRRHLPPALRMGWLLTVLNVAAGVLFCALGLKGYWDHSGWGSLLILSATLAFGWTGALLLRKFITNAQLSHTPR